jgi:hypothetical protein
MAYTRDPNRARGLLDQESIWAESCPVKTCRARIGERCRKPNGEPTHEHPARVARMNAKRVAKVYSSKFESNRQRY